MELELEIFGNIIGMGNSMLSSFGDDKYQLPTVRSPARR